MKKVLFAMVVSSVASLFAEPTVESVTVTQLWPFSSRVRVEYVLSGVTGVVNVTPTFYRDGSELAAPGFAEDFRGEIYGIVTDGAHSFTFDPAKTFGLMAGEIVNLQCNLALSAGAAKMTDVLYKVIDLETGAVDDLKRADFYNNLYGSFTTDFASFKEDKDVPWTTDLEDVFVWTGIADNPVFKDRKLALRYIPAKGKTFRMGTDTVTSSASPAHLVTLTNDYYIGVFNMTQAQYYRLTGGYGNAYTTNTVTYNHLYMPVCAGTPNDLRGVIDADVHVFDETKFFGKLNKLLDGRLLCDIPTEARWEFAGRAGTTNNVYNNAFGASDGSVQTKVAEVGKVKPNAFGLYDMQGGIEEWCADYHAEYSVLVTDPETPVVEPTGAATGNRVGRAATSGNGGSPGINNRFMNICARRTRSTGDVTFRLWAIVP